MAFIIDAALDATLEYIADNGVRVDLTSQEATSYAEATSTYTLANYTLTAGDGNGDWTIVAGSPSGRALRLEAKTGNNGTATDTADFFAITNGTDTLLLTGPADGDTVNNGSPANIPQSVVYTQPDAS